MKKLFKTIIQENSIGKISLSLGKAGLIFLFYMMSALTLGHTQSLKIGVVDTSYVLENAPQSSRFREKVSSEFASREREINANRSKLRELQAALDQAKNAMESDEILNKINRLDRDTARLADDFRQDYTLRINEELLKVQKEVSAEIIKYAEEEHFDLILESGVFYVSPKLVVTEEILSRLK